MAEGTVKDFLFGSRTLGSLASGQPKSDSNYVPATKSDADRNEDYAAKRLASQKQGKSPLATTMTPVAKPATKAKGK